MNPVDEAIARYHSILDTEPFRDLNWVERFHGTLRTRKLELGNRPVSPFLRPHLVTREQYDGLVTGGQLLASAVDQLRKMAMDNPTLMARMDLLPAERMLASVNPGYKHFAVTGLLDTALENGHMRFSDYSAETPVGVLYAEVLAEELYETGPMKEFRKVTKVAKLGGVKYLQSALLKAYKEFGGKNAPQVAILEMRHPFETLESREYHLLAENFSAHGLPTILASPEQLEYKNGVLRKGDFVIDIVYRRMKTREFVVHFDPNNHPLVRAYRDGKVCIVNSFRSDLAQKKAVFDLLTDEAVLAHFPAADRTAIRKLIPTTRVVSERMVAWDGAEEVDLVPFIGANRERLVLRPNDDTEERQTYVGAEMDQTGWERAVRTALRSAYVVQENVKAPTAKFPVYSYGSLDFKEMRVEVHPHVYLGKVQGASSWLTPAAGTFSTVTGITPTYLLETK
jgi:uncharacterized circularly permuted ATP-grasp superfamily protein